MINLFELQQKVYCTLVELGYKDIGFCGDNYENGYYISTWSNKDVMILSQVDISDITSLTYQIFKAS